MQEQFDFFQVTLAIPICTIMKIALVGYMGSGKTFTAKALAEKLDLDFLDLDAEIESQMQRSISEIISEKGELYFRKKERETLSRLLKGSNFVLATGGGTPCYYDNMELLNANSDTYFLSTSVKVLGLRLVKEKATRPLISHIADENLNEFVAKHLFERRHFYEQAKHTLQGPDFINEILNRYEK